MDALILVVAIGIAAAMAICVYCAARRVTLDREEYERNWPPISDDEFLAACPPGTDRFIALRVRKIVSEQLGVEYERLHPAMRFVEDLGA